MDAMVRRLLVLAVLLTLGVPAAAQGAIRLGPDVTKPLPSGGFHLAGLGCNSAPQLNPCAFINAASTNPDVVVASPIDGVVSSWSFRGGCCTADPGLAHRITLGTYRTSVAGYVYTSAVRVGEAFEIPPGNALLSDPATTLPARVPIQRGEVIGVIADAASGFAVDDSIANVTYTIISNTYNYGYAYSGAAIQLSAKVEPDADGDGYGDETQDCAPADAVVHDGCAPPAAPVYPPAPVSPLPVGCNAPVCAGTTSGSGGSAVPPTPAPVPKTGPIAPPSDPNSVYISLTCPSNVPQHCGGYLILLPNGSKAAGAAAAPRTRYVIAAGKSKAIKVPLTAKLRAKLKHDRRLKVTLRLQPDGGPASTFSKTITLKKKTPKRPARR
jgi:hypothetical protein